MTNSEDKGNLPNQDILYHYTSLSGLKGIVETGKIWATNILYLNDSEEFFNAKEAFNSVFQAMWDNPEEIDALTEDEQDFLSMLDTLVSAKRRLTIVGQWCKRAAEKEQRGSLMRAAIQKVTKIAHKVVVGVVFRVLARFPLSK